MKASECPLIPEHITLPKNARVYSQNEGYLRIQYYNESIGRSVFEALSRYVWQFFNGPIPDGWVIHHIDGDPLNNDIKNLQAMPRSEHSRLHRLHPENSSQLYADYHAKNAEKEKLKHQKYIAPKRKAQRVAAKGDTRCS